MKKALILGAGLSSTTLIGYMLKHAKSNGWRVRVGDMIEERAQNKIGNHPDGEAFKFDIENLQSLDEEVHASSLVISMLPSHLHYLVASSCVRNGRPMVSTYYVSREIEKMDKEARKKGILLMTEVGVDPGLNHMMAMQIINRIRDNGGKITSYESFAGGLMAPGYDNNPWRYKFTWAPMDVVLAGQGGARFYDNGKYKYIPYQKIFQRIETIDIPGLGQFEVYPEQDSLRYKNAYGLEDLLTMFKGTIRRPGFCKAWDMLVQLGATDDSYIMDDTENMTCREFIDSFLPYNIIDPVELRLANYLGIEADSDLMKKLRWLGLLEDKKIGIPNLTPARVLLHLLEQKWQLQAGDKDMIVMQHQVDYNHLGTHRRIYSSMVVVSELTGHSAMSISVGLPVAVIAKLILQGSVKLSGVQIPVYREIYEPVLSEMAGYGIKFEEKDIRLS